MGKPTNKDEQLSLRIESTLYEDLNTARLQEPYPVPMTAYIRQRLAHSLQVAPVLAEVVAGPTVAQLVMQLEQHTQQIQDLIQRMDQVNPQFGKPT